jgi:hypothetical protein
MERIDNETAQVILIGGFLIALGVVSAFLILNDISYSQTVASQNGNSGDFGPAEFADGAEAAVSEAMTGNGTDPSNASVQFDAYIQSYSDRTDDLLSDEAVSVSLQPRIPLPNSDVTEAWMVGQRKNGTFQNATGGERWIMAEEIDENYRTRFHLDVDGMNNTDDGVFVMNATESNTFNDLTGPLTGNGWRLTMNISTSDQLTLNLTEVASGNLDFSNPGTTTDETTVNVGGEETVTVDVYNETVDGSGSDFPTVSNVDPPDADGFRFEYASNGTGTYDFRFDDGVGRFTDANGPCDHPDGPPCRSDDGTEKHAVGVVHNTTGDAVELDYIGRSAEYTKKVGGMTLDADDVNLNDTNNVDGKSYFDVNITGDNAPVAEGNPVEVLYEVENTGTVSDDQSIRLRIDGSVKDTDSTSTLSTGGVSSGTLSWSTTATPGDNGTYTAYVSSENTTDTTQITVDKTSGPAIPSGPVGFALPSLVETFAGVTQR